MCGLIDLGRLVPVASIQQMRIAMVTGLPLRHVEDRRRRLGIGLPVSIDLFIDRLRLGDAQPPGGEEYVLLLWGPLRDWSLKRQHRGVSDRRGRGSRLSREAQPAAAQHVGHPPGDLELRSLREIQRVLELHDRHRRLIATADAPIRRPGGLVLAINQKRDGTVELLAIGTFSLGLGKVSRGVHELQLFPVFGGRLLDERLQFADPPGAESAAARSLMGQIAMVERLELQPGHPVERGR